MNKKNIFTIAVFLFLGLTFINPLKSYATQTYDSTKDFDVRTENKITGDDLEKVIEKNTSEGSYLRGMGKILESGSKASGINMAFAFAQMVSENGWGNDSSATTSLQNHNYGNLRGTGNNGTYDLPNNPNFASFKTKEDGVKAYYDLLWGYVNGKSPATETNKAGTVLNTVEKMAYVYAPPSDNNNTREYVTNIGNFMEMAGQPPVTGKFMEGTGTYENLGDSDKDEENEVGYLLNKYKFVSDATNKVNSTSLGKEKEGMSNGVIERFNVWSRTLNEKAKWYKGVLVAILIIYVLFIALIYFTELEIFLPDKMLNLTDKMGITGESRYQDKIKILINVLIILSILACVLADAHILLMACIYEILSKFVEIIISITGMF